MANSGVANSEDNATGVGTICLKLTDRKGDVHDVRLCNVMYAPRMTHNLLSVSVATEHGAVFRFTKDKAELSVGENTFELRKRGKLYSLQCELPGQLAATVVDNTPAELWHHRLGHVGYSTLKNLQKHVDGIPISAFECAHERYCEICNQSKMVHEPFTKDGSGLGQFTSFLDRAYIDLCGPVSEFSLGGAQYMMVFVDAASRWLHVEFLSKKTETLDKL